MYFTIKDSLLSASAVESASSVGLCCLCRRQGSLENLYTGKIQTRRVSNNPNAPGLWNGGVWGFSPIPIGL